MDSQSNYQLIQLEACGVCGQPLKAAWKFCPNCQTRLETSSCPHCHREATQYWNYCPYCNQEMTKDPVPSSDDPIKNSNQWLKQILAKN